MKRAKGHTVCHSPNLRAAREALPLPIAPHPLPAASLFCVAHGGRLREGARAASAARDKEEKADALAGPYSQFRVGAALLIHPTSTSRFTSTATPNADGAPEIILGANVENAAYPVGTCAERVAVGTAVTSFGYGRGDIKAVGVATDLREEHCSPCGMCRQFLREFLEVSA